MSLYLEAASILTQKEGSLKSRIYSPKSTLKSPPAKLYALIVETLKHQELLNEVIGAAGLLQHEKKLSHPLALLLTHDLLFTTRGIATSDGPLKQQINRHQTRLKAEFKRALIKRGYGSKDALLTATAAAEDAIALPRWIRINAIQTTADKVVKSHFSDYKAVTNLSELTPPGRNPKEKIYYRCEYVPDLLAFPASAKIDFTKHKLYGDGDIIIQDRSSCFPAVLLLPPPGAKVIDGTAAPGNKTTHLAALVSSSKQSSVLAFEKDPKRAETLKKMVHKARAEKIVTIRAGADFLETRPKKEVELRDVTHILLDPSCSGSGIVGREDPTLLPPPAAITAEAGGRNAKKNLKRKREQVVARGATDAASENNTVDAKDKDRLAALAAFQANIVQHAMTFPAARRISYSTCSIHAEENENVVMAILASKVAKRRGWRVLKREEQVILGKWPRRGLVEHCNGDKDVAEACIRCNPGEDGGIGFFVAAFARDGEENDDYEEEEVVEVKDRKVDANEEQEEGKWDVEEEWKGFSDDEGIASEKEDEPSRKVKPLVKKAMQNQKKKQTQRKRAKMGGN